MVMNDIYHKLYPNTARKINNNTHKTYKQSQTKNKLAKNKSRATTTALLVYYQQIQSVLTASQNMCLKRKLEYYVCKMSHQNEIH